MIGRATDGEPKYNLLCRWPELEVLPGAQVHGVGVLAYSPTSQGLLAGKFRRGQLFSRNQAAQTERVKQIAQSLSDFHAISNEVGCTEAQLSVAWLLAKPEASSVLIGPRTVEQLTEILPAFDLHLDSTVLAQLDKIFPGPGGPAPEAYAW